MWNDMDKSVQGGGFLSTPGGGGFSSPSGGGSGEKRAERVQSVVPVLASTVLATSPDEPLRVAGAEVHLAVLAGRLDAIDRAPTKVTYTLTDGTGSVSAARWLDAEGGAEPDADLSEGMTVRMVARVRAGKTGSSVLCFHLEAISPEEEAVHRLEVQHAALKIQQAQALESGAAPAAGGLAGSAAAPLGDVPMVTGGGIPGLTPQQQLVYGAIQACASDQGLHRDQVYASVGGRLPRPEVDRIMEFLSNEGHIYNTTDDDHFKATDC